MAILTSQLLNAQVQDWINAEPDELRALARRTLVVEIPEENPKEIDRFNKKTAEERTADYRATLESYRQVIEPAVRATWTFNEEIEFRTTSEILELFKQKSTKHVALMKAVLLNGGPVAANSPATVVPAFVLTRTDGKRHKANPQGVAPPAPTIPRIPPAQVLPRLAALQTATAAELKAQWRALFGKEPPPLNRPYLVSRLAYRIQELAYGGLKPETRA
ncbi:MAG TPA: DUF2924 domain-containing protein, partial [Flavobacteriales bacterium]|nr:DUF2924 domain-containing protein [Flavobacteriales bacterium]